MNYEQLYAYLDTRPVAEIKECLDNVVKLVRNHTPVGQHSELPSSFGSSLDASMETSAGIQSTMHRLQTAQRVWTQQAVWNKFGTRSVHHHSVQELALASSHLLTNKDVAQYVLHVTNQVETKANDPSYDISAQFGTKVASKGSVTDSVSISATGTKKQRVEKPSNVISLVESSSDDGSKECGGGETVRVCTGDQTKTASTGVKRKLNSGGAVSAWTPEAEEALASAVAQFKDQGWEVIAEHVGRGFSKTQCNARWCHFIEPLQSGLRKGVEWTEEEIAKLERLVAKHTVEPYWSEGIKAMTKQRVDWKAIGKVLNRVPTDCSHKWRALEHAKKTKIPFTKEDDALIVRREMEWGDRGVGLWAALENEMGRPGINIRRRWKEIYECGP